MKPRSQHTRILLSRNEGGAIAFCESCDVLELEVGAVSLRIDSSSLELLSKLMHEATASMKTYKQEKARFTQAMQQNFGLH
jgi:ABC-type transporter Mla MlaB component